jgi:phage-related minor tail protein
MDDAALVFVAKLDDQASAAARRLEDTMGSLGGPVDPIEAAVLMAAEGIEETEAAFDDAGAAIVDAGVAAGEAAGAGVVDGLDGVAGEAGDAGQEVGEELITQAEQSTNEAAPRLGTAMQAAVLGAVALAVGAAAGLYAIGDTFDAVSDGLRVGTGASGDALGELEGIVESIGRSIPADFETIGSAVGDLNTRLGLTGAPLETLASQVVTLDRLGDSVDLNTLTQALSVFGVEAGNESAVLDDLFRVSQATGVGVNELAGNIASGAAALKPFGFTIGESAALLGTLDKAGIDSGSTVSALQRGLVNFAQAGKDPRAALEEVIGGIEGYLAVGDTAAAIDVASQVFGTRGAAQFVNAVDSGKLALDDLMGAAGVTGDTILGLGEETSDAAESWQILRNNFLAEVGPYAEEAFGALGTALSEAVEYLPQLIATGAGVIEWLNENKGAVLGVVAVMGTLMAVTAAHRVPRRAGRRRARRVRRTARHRADRHPRRCGRAVAVERRDVGEPDRHHRRRDRCARRRPHLVLHADGGRAGDRRGRVGRDPDRHDRRVRLVDEHRRPRVERRV